MIIQNLKRFENTYANLRIKIKTICDEYLNLSKEIVTKINDDTILKTIFLKIFYPSQVSLLKILYEDRDYFTPILQNDILFDIVTDLWYCEYYWTPNFMNSSSALKNLISHYGSKDLHLNPLEERFFMNKMIENDAFETDTNEEQVLDAKEDLENTPMSYLLFHRNIKGEFVTCAQKEIDMQDPFFFYQKTRFSRDIRYTNHIFSYYFFEKSPLFKVSFEIIIYTLISAIILFNVFSIFRIRRDFDSTPHEILHLSDGLVDIEYGLSTSEEFNYVIQNFTGGSGTPMAQAMQMITTDSFLQICETIFPWFIEDCVVFDQDAEQIIPARRIFWILQLFYYLVFLQTLLEIIFIWKISKRIQISSKNYLDISLGILNIYIHAYYFQNLNGVLYILKNNELSEYQMLEEIVAVFIFLIWMKFITYLKLIKQFGTIIKVIEVMMTKSITFFVILAIIILAFASICAYLFDQVDPSEFGTFWVTLQTLLVFMFGQIEFFNFTDDLLLAGIIINLFEITTYVLLLNLLIAMLSNTFNSLTTMSNLQNASVLYNDYLSKKPDKFYSALTDISPPFNIYMIIAAPIILLKKSSKLNKICVFIGFFMYSLIFLAIYIATNLALVIPLCYLRLALTLPINLILEQRQKNGIYVWLLWLFCGPFYMVWILFKHDVVLFVRSMFYACSMKDKLDEITKEEIMLLYQRAEENLAKGNEYLNYNEFIDSVKEGIEEINRNFRQHSIVTKNSNWNIIENLKKKTAKIIGMPNNQEIKEKEKDREDLSEKIENKINVFVEIDKMEVFSFLRQFIGINGKINMEKLKFLVNQIKFCKKFNVVSLSKAKRNKLMKVIQVNQMLAVEKGVINMMAEQVRNSKIFDKVLKKFIC